MAIVAFLETEDRDFALFEGNLILVGDARVIAQRVENRFRFFLGEWFLDVREGVPYWELVLIKGPNIGIIRQLFLKVIVETPGMADVLEFDMQYDPTLRTLYYQWEGITDDGDPVSGDNAFVVTE
jgi:hypothetical protein